MGYPFDRSTGNYVESLIDFLRPNMKVREVNVKFLNITIPPRSPIADPDPSIQTPESV